MTFRSARAARGRMGRLIRVGACVWLVIAMVGWVGAGMEVVVDKQAGKSHRGLVVCREIPEHFPSAKWRN